MAEKRIGLNWCDKPLSLFNWLFQLLGLHSDECVDGGLRELQAWAGAGLSGGGGRGNIFLGGAGPRLTTKRCVLFCLQGLAFLL